MDHHSALFLTGVCTHVDEKDEKAKRNKGLQRADQKSINWCKYRRCRCDRSLDEAHPACLPVPLPHSFVVRSPRPK